MRAYIASQAGIPMDSGFDRPLLIEAENRHEAEAKLDVFFGNLGYASITQPDGAGGHTLVVFTPGFFKLVFHIVEVRRINDE